MAVKSNPSDVLAQVSLGEGNLQASEASNSRKQIDDPRCGIHVTWLVVDKFHVSKADELSKALCLELQRIDRLAAGVLIYSQLQNRARMAHRAPVTSCSRLGERSIRKPKLLCFLPGEWGTPYRVIRTDTMVPPEGIDGFILFVSEASSWQCRS